ncbi:MAG: winged helix-turn-helix domain-containing protein [Candidatus Sulfotelmatobacter sp.]
MPKFSDFELDERAYELRRAGSALKLERIPMDLLCLLVRSAGQLVSRDTIIERLWGKDVFLDTDNSINTAVRKIRQILGDDPRNPRFVQTVPGKGYRFAASVTDDSRVMPEPNRNLDISQRVMLAVLPFENLSNDIEQEYFSDGLTEETISYLGQLDPQSLGVIARTSSMVYKRTAKTIAEIGRELGVNFVVEGSVRREKERVRITAQLIRVTDQTHLWAESYDREIGSVLGVQTELGVSIAKQVKLQLGGKEKARFATDAERNPEAHDAYLRGRYHWAKRTFAETRKAIEYFRKATDAEPTYAKAYAGLADCYITLPITSDMKSKDCFPKATIAASKALELDGNLAEAHTSLGTIRFWFDWDWSGAEECYQRALQINPNYMLGRLYRAHCLSNTGRDEEAIAEIKRALRLDPLSPILSTLLGFFLYHARRYDEAVAEFHNALELAPRFWIAHLDLAKLYEQTGEQGRAISELELARTFCDGNSEPLSLLGYVLAKSGRQAEAENALAELMALSRQKYVPPPNIALVYAGLGKRDQMFEWLERGIQDRDVRMTFLRDPKWDGFRENPRFREILRQVALDGN